MAVWGGELRRRWGGGCLICNLFSRLSVASLSMPSKKWYNVGKFFWGIMLLNGKWLMKESRKKLLVRPKMDEVTTVKSCTSSRKRGRVSISESGEVVKFAEEGMPQLDVWLENETVWLSQKQMACLFGCSDENIRLHIRNIYLDGELEQGATSKDFLEVRTEGKRRVTRKFAYYNLDMIISVGFRVNTKTGIKFRQWATSVLKEYLLRGLVRDRRIGKLEKRMTAAERSIDTILYTLMPALPENRNPIGFHT